MSRRIGGLIVAVLVLVPLLVPLPAIAEGASQEDQPPAVKLRLYPKAEPRPALKYQLLPPFPDLRPGNAAVLYGKVTAENMRFFGNGELQEKTCDWQETPLAAFPSEEVHNALPLSPFQFLERGARCEYVDWQLPLREEVFWEILLPDIQQSRTFGRILATKARLQMAEGQFDEAVHTFQTGYALGRHVAQGQTLVNGLVGVAISGIMSKQVETFVQQPDAPNLYWALTYLPDPLIDMRSGVDAELSILYLSFPELRDLEEKDYSADRWRGLLNKLFTEIMRASGGDQMPARTTELVTTGLALRGYPMAKRAMIERGYAPGEVEAWPVAKVMLLHSVRTYEEYRDDLFKWFATPYPIARDRTERVENSLYRDARRREVIPLASILLPAIRAVQRADARGRRSIAALRVVEAIRLYGAANNGQLPEKLDSITEVPIPIDPTTGEPFIYRRSGDTATLESPDDEYQGMLYEITFAPKGE